MNGHDNAPLTDAQRELVESNTRLAYYFARRRYPLADGVRITTDDIDQIALMGLCKAARNYDAQRGIAFSTCAVRYIKTELFKAFRANQSVWHVPRGYDAPVSVSLDKPVPNANGVTYMETLGAHDDLSDMYTNALIDDILRRLPLRERDIMRRVALGHTQRDIGRDLSISTTRVSQIWLRCKKKLEVMAR